MRRKCGRNFRRLFGIFRDQIRRATVQGSPLRGLDPSDHELLIRCHARPSIVRQDQDDLI